MTNSESFVSRGNIIFLGRKKAFNCQIFINELKVGDYHLTLEIPSDQDLRIPIKVVSSSETLSMNQRYLDFEKSGKSLKIGEGERLTSYTIAYRVGYQSYSRIDDGAESQISNDSSDVVYQLPDFARNTHVALIVEPRNIYNNAYNFTNATLTKLAGQISAVAVNLDTGDSYSLQIKMLESENVSKADQEYPFVPLKMLYVSEEALNKSGRYTLKAFFTDLTQGQLYLAGSTFRILPDAGAQEKSTDLYLTKGPQKSATSTYQRLMPYPTSPEAGYSPGEEESALTPSAAPGSSSTPTNRTESSSLSPLEKALKGRA